MSQIFRTNSDMLLVRFDQVVSANEGTLKNRDKKALVKEGDRDSFD